MPNLNNPCRAVEKDPAGRWWMDGKCLVGMHEDDARDLVAKTESINWRICTRRFDSWGWAGEFPNVWLGTYVETQEDAERWIPELLAVPLPRAKRFLRIEPARGMINLADLAFFVDENGEIQDQGEDRDPTDNPLIHEVFYGVVAGQGMVFVEHILQQCWAANVPCTFTQWLEG